MQNMTTEEFLEKMNKELKKVYSLKDHYKNLKMIEENILCDFFGKKDAASHSLEDCRQRLKEMTGKAYEKKYFFKEFSQKVRLWKKDMEQTEQEISDRKRFRKALERYAEEEKGTVLFDRTISYQGITCDIDAILIVPSEILLLTLKVPTGDSGIDEQGYLCRMDMETMTISAVSVQNEMKKQLLLMRMILHDGSEEQSVTSSLIIGGTHEFHSIYKNRREDIFFGRLESMEKKIHFFKKGRPYTSAMIHVLVNMIEHFQVTARKEPVPKEYDIIDAYCELREKL